VDLCLF